MSHPCNVCTHVDRSEIDWRLTFPVINLADIAREYTVSRDSLKAHRANHLPGALIEYHATADRPWRMSDREQDVWEPYLNALDALARAERGALLAIGRHDSEPFLLSMSEIAHQIRLARAGLDQLTRLAADAASNQPDDPESEALNARLREQWQNIASRDINANQQS
jgi:hypothetical protein